MILMKTHFYFQTDDTEADLMDFFKEVTWSKKKCQFVTPTTTEEKYVSVLSL